MNYFDYKKFPTGLCLIVPVYVNRWEMSLKRFVRLNYILEEFT